IGRCRRVRMSVAHSVTLDKLTHFRPLQRDHVLVGRWLGAATLGFYGRAYEPMAAAPALVGEPVDKVVFPAMAARQGDLRALAAAYRRAVATLAVVPLPLSAVLPALAPAPGPALL